MASIASNSLGTYLRDRRTRIDPAALGIAEGRRRTAGLRREEVAQRANISTTWYTWLEQGRGGAPSADVLDRIARAMLLTEPEREHLYMLGLGRPPAVKYKTIDAVTPRLQRVLDAFGFSPALIKNATWDVIAWNAAAAALFTDYSALPRDERNILRLMFGSRKVRSFQDDWLSVARAVVAAFRADAIRAGASAEMTALINDLRETSPDFAALWDENEVVSHGDGIKRLHHPDAGRIELEFSSFAVDGRPEIGMIVYNPATEVDTAKIRKLMTTT